MLTKKLLAKRLNSIISNVTETDQSGYIKGRYIGENVRMIEDVRYTDKNDTPGVLLFLDFKKAFDSISREYLIAALEAHNFGPEFITWVKVIYNDTSSCLIQNGNVSAFFSLEKGVRQGCPLSALLFIIAIETLACKIRQSKQINGIKLPKQDYEKAEARVALYADDITIFTESASDINKVLKIVNDLTKVSGLRLNVQKTEALWIGSNKRNQNKPFGLNWKIKHDDTVKSLGVCFSNSKPLTEIEQNWSAKVDTIKNIINAWKRRNLTIVGRITVVKCLLASQLSYIGSVMRVPDEVVNELNSLFFTFIWNSNEKVKRKTLIAENDKGGLKMVHLHSFLKSLRISWIKRILNTNISTWKNIPLFEFSLNDLNLNIFKCNCCYENLNETCQKQLRKMSPFYQDLVEFWLNTKPVIDEKNIVDPSQEIVWNNSCIKISGNTLFIPDLIKADITRLTDLFDENNMFLSMDKLCRKLKKTGRTFINYYAIKTAVPRNWKTRIKETNTVKSENVTYGLKWNDVFYSLEKCSSSICRKILTSKLIVKPICEKSWEKEFKNLTFNWKQVWTNVLCLKEPRLVTLNWKILFRIYPTRMYLYKIGKVENNLCERCNELDDIAHFFIKCKSIKEIWDKVNEIISKMLSRNIQISVREILFGCNKGNKEINRRINEIISIAKMCVSKYKYGQKINIIVLLQQELRLRHIK